MARRNVTLDVIKGVLIILVVLGHSLQFGFGSDYEKSELFYDDYLFRAIYIFHMPLFMAVSGYLFWFSNKKPFWSVLTSKLIGIGIPFMTFFLLLYAVIWYSYHTNSFYLSDFLRKMTFYMWFLSSVLLNCIVMAVITHLLKERGAISMCVLFFCLLHIVSDDMIPAMHKYMFFYFAVGYWYNHFHIRIHKLTNSRLMALTLTTVFVGCVVFYNRSLFIYVSGLNILDNGTVSWIQIWTDVVRYIIGVVGCSWLLCLVLCFRNNLGKLSPLTHLGTQTLPIYGFQSLAYMIVSLSMDSYGISFHRNYLLACVTTLSILAFCEGLIWLCGTNGATSLMFLGKRNHKKDQA